METGLSIEHDCQDGSGNISYGLLSTVNVKDYMLKVSSLC